MALFRFPTVAVEADVDQKVAVRDPITGKFYYVTIQDIVDLAVTGGVSIPSITDDGTTVTLDSDLVVTGDTDLSAGAVILDLPTTDPAVVGQLWIDTGVFKLSTGP